MIWTDGRSLFMSLNTDYTLFVSVIHGFLSNDYFQNQNIFFYYT